MENGYHGFGKLRDEDGSMDLPPGFRFHPTDEELIRHYLQRKVVDTGFASRAIGDVDLNKSEPWELPWKAKLGEKEWYFFCVRDRKYPTGLRTNRATEAGYWKATGKDKEIYSGRSLVGMKKTLVFYRGRAPKGEKTNWVMHEYRLEGKLSRHSLNLPKSSKSEWVICRVFHKTYVASKAPYIQNVAIHGLPPLADPSPSKFKRSAVAETAAATYVPCFSNNSALFYGNNSRDILPLPKFPYHHQFSYPSPGLLQESSLLGVLLESNNTNFGTDSSARFDLGRRGIMEGDQDAAPSTSSAEQDDLGFIWD
ncbi:hypothetical protein MLD38_027998 [Melastoma candidum]|uniref:Uncharacterized protein n=1 Tax=Melastoma candidum TaxID=119954 RepID=A0ACB9N082_9MYRT|nr:hypothetical protein MLD38_027998 [Melastoma candidum]